FLPAFHSFGLTVTTLLPLLTGLRVVHHPDPTDAANLVHKISAYGVTVLVGTPTFVCYILERAMPGSLAALRLVVLGAEKCPPALLAQLREAAPRATVVEIGPQLAVGRRPLQPQARQGVDLADTAMPKSE